MKKILLSVTALVMSAAMITGCTATDGNTDADNASTTEISGTVNMNGSTSMKKLVEASCEIFNSENPTITAQGQFTGSSAGLEALAAGSVDIGNSSRALKEEEKANGLVENIVAIDGIGVVVDKANTVGDLTSEQLKQVFSGEVKNWAELGGNDGSIIVIGREAGSGTRDAFEEMLKIEDKCVYAQELDQTGAVLTTVASTPNAIGYVSLDVIDDTVSAVKIDGVEATPEEIKAGNYPLQRPFVMATKGEISEQTPAVQKWFEFLASDDGKVVIENVGLITVD